MGYDLVEAVATAFQFWDGKPLRNGDPFWCTVSELDDLRVLGYARRAPSRPPEAYPKQPPEAIPEAQPILESAAPPPAEMPAVQTPDAEAQPSRRRRDTTDAAPVRRRRTVESNDSNAEGG